MFLIFVVKMQLCSDQFISLYGVFIVMIRIYHTFESVCHKIIYMGIVLHCFCRTLKALLLHLACLAKQCHKTGMTSHNLVIVLGTQHFPLQGG
jgi:hypothetical protein